jgi:hypothetical protein
MIQVPLSLKKFHDGPSGAFIRLKTSQFSGQTETLKRCSATLDTYHFHPPFPKDGSLYNQTLLAEVTESDLTEIRRLPRYSVVQKLLHFVYLLVFEVVKLLSTLLFALLAAPFFIACCALWRAAGRPEWDRRFCHRL